MDLGMLAISYPWALINTLVKWILQIWSPLIQSIPAATSLNTSSRIPFVFIDSSPHQTPLRIPGWNLLSKSPSIRQTSPTQLTDRANSYPIQISLNGSTWPTVSKTRSLKLNQSRTRNRMALNRYTEQRQSPLWKIDYRLKDLRKLSATHRQL